MPELLPNLDGFLWDDVLDSLYAQAHKFWEADKPEVADAIAELADALAAHPPIARLRSEA
ncbi:hypothetical protein EV644_103669 [Kribbella orskensis]|uniref:Barstar (Barnase inhibitor) n=1 Tax=Kribbella orskensis TaxID=2512216 RepID=A0ABY2BR92_9ACTN|nr:MULTISPECIES: hypothetical protein [Kribbella]TCN28169.1 hypothetical protein EV642_1557 [Kribbella sp. VKM Ac-2500]TCO27965.1 hypothetical protein EV644_103669 [Kribbella orskensis]